MLAYHPRRQDANPSSASCFGFPLPLTAPHCRQAPINTPQLQTSSSQPAQSTFAADQAAVQYMPSSYDFGNHDPQVSAVYSSDNLMVDSDACTAEWDAFGTSRQSPAAPSSLHSPALINSHSSHQRSPSSSTNESTTSAYDPAAFHYSSTSQTAELQLVYGGDDIAGACSNHLPTPSLTPIHDTSNPEYSFDFCGSNIILRNGNLSAENSVSSHQETPRALEPPKFKFAPTTADSYIDAPYNDSNSQQPLPLQSGVATLLSPRSDFITDRLAAAQRAHSQPPDTPKQRAFSPFKPNSPFTSASVSVLSTQGRLDSTHQQLPDQHTSHTYTAHSLHEPQTISPKDAYLASNDSEDLALIPDLSDSSCSRPPTRDSWSDQSAADATLDLGIATLPPTSNDGTRSTVVHRPANTSANTGTYTCTYHRCTKRFESPQELQSHKREIHRTPKSGVASSQNGPHKCVRINPATGNPCQGSFSRPYDLTRHEHTIHNARKDKVRCALCAEEKTFSRNDALTRHMRVVHPEVDIPGKHSRRSGANASSTTT